ncbi:uncharacterized protein VTP21DRAFT_2579 [Calcarisporiella thermophila]|uniref:uncharacterized protein n=1 Tax=Calcarisporiella thermophila TaxID=911321 RepID=UPI003742850E
MCKQAFAALVMMLERNPSLHSTGPTQQLPVWVQLLIFLRRLSNGNDVFDLASKYSIAEGTVIKVTKRITLAIESLRPEYVTWPNTRRKEEIKNKFLDMSGFPDVVGIIDGTHFRLNFAPSKDPETYWSRKKEYAVQAQLIVDSDFRFIDYEIGWPGSVHDAKVYVNSQFFRQREVLLHPPEYIIGDSAYPISPFCITPFRSPQNRQERIFNTIFSSKIRNIIERAIGRLKNHFPAFYSLCLKGMESNCRLIHCGIMLHNFVESFGDEWEVDEGNILEEMDDELTYNMDCDRSARALGKEKRSNLLTEVLLRNGYD